MKKILFAFCFVLMSAILFIPVCAADGGEYDTLPGMNLKVFVPENADAVLMENEFYIYAGETGSIPYVMIRTYPYTSAERFIYIFTKYMQEEYADLKVTAEAEQKVIGDKQCWEIDYGYNISGYQAADRRIVTVVNGTTYVFASKEVEELGMSTGNMLEDVVEKSEFISLKGDDSDTVTNWKIRIYKPDNTTAVLKGTEYYIYAQNAGSIPYVMLTTFNGYDSGEKFFTELTDYMREQYGDLAVAAEPMQRRIGDKDCWETVFTYDVSGNKIIDRRIVTFRNNAAYLFTSKECSELYMMIDNMLEEVVTNAEFLP